MVWSVYPGEYPQQEDEDAWAAAGRDEAPGARTGVNIGSPIPRIVYGVYESQNEAEAAVAEISDKLQENAPLRIPNTGTGCSSSQRTGSTT